MADWAWMSRRGDQLRSRRAARRDDEEPDDDMLAADEWVSRRLHRTGTHVDGVLSSELRVRST